MSSAVRDLQKAIVQGKQSLRQLLRQTNWIAARLGLHDVKRWVGLELTGFVEDAEPPPYRSVFTHSLEIYNSQRDHWQFAGKLNYALKVRQPIAEIETFSRQDRIEIPVEKNFSIKNDWADSFGSDWPQRFVVRGSEYQRVVKTVAKLWMNELELRGIRVFDVRKFGAFLEALPEVSSRRAASYRS